MLRAHRTGMTGVWLSAVAFGALIHLFCAGSLLAQPQTVPGGTAGVDRGERTGAGQVHTDPAIRHVLLLFSGRFNAPLSIAVDDAVRATFRRTPSMPVELYTETLDVARFDPERYGPLLAGYLRGKFADRHIDLIITSLPQAPRFLLTFRKELFPDTPIVYCLADESELAGLVPAPKVVGVPIHLPWKETLDLALGVAPDTRHVAVIAGTDGLARFFLRQTQRIFQPYTNQLTFTYLTDQTLSQLLQEVAVLPPHTAIIYTTFAMDSAGHVYIDAEVSGMVAQAANAPAYGTNSTFFGRGIIGGRIVDGGAHAARAAEIGRRILAGETPEAIQAGDVPSPPMFDARQLQRWNIAESRLPAGSVVLYKGPSFWEQYRLFLLIIGACLVEAALIVILLVQRRRRRLAEASLGKTESQYRNIFEGAVEGIFETSPQGKPLTANPAMARILGYASPEEFLSSVQDTTRQVFADPTKRAEYVALLEKQHVVLGFECEVLRRDGTRIWVSLNSRRVCGPDGRTLHYSGFLEDITEQKRAEQEVARYREHLEELVLERTTELVIAKERAEKADRAKSTFLANMSHELRTPLNNMLGVAQLMERDPSFPPARRDMLEVLSRSGTHLLELVDDVLETAKIEAGRLPLALTHFDLYRFLDDLEEAMRLRADGKGLRLIFHREVGLPRHVCSDPRRLRQVLINLLSNAIRYTDKGQVALTVRYGRTASEVRKGRGVAPILAGPAAEGDADRRVDGWLAFDVADTGIGIAEEDLERIFEPFVQINPGRGVSEGAGLGLTLSRGLVTLLGGRIAVRSQAGAGTCFAFDIPVELGDAGGEAGERKPLRAVALAAGQPRYRILIVDDSSDGRSVLRQLLEQAGFTVLEAADGREALDVCAGQRPDLVLMDLRMPTMDGYQTIERLRSAECGLRFADCGLPSDGGKPGRIPVIAVTAHVTAEGGPSVLAAGFDDVIYKPVDAPELFDKLGKHLGVQYEYRVPEAPGQGGVEPKPPLDLGDLSAAPAEWVREFSRTLRRGRSAPLFALIDHLPPECAAVGCRLADLVRVHAFDKLIAVTEAVLGDRSHG